MSKKEELKNEKVENKEAVKKETKKTATKKTSTSKKSPKKESTNTTKDKPKNLADKKEVKNGENIDKVVNEKGNESVVENENEKISEEVTENTKKNVKDSPKNTPKTDTEAPKRPKARKDLESYLPHGYMPKYGKFGRGEGFYIVSYWVFDWIKENETDWFEKLDICPYYQDMDTVYSILYYIVHEGSVIIRENRNSEYFRISLEHINKTQL